MRRIILTGPESTGKTTLAQSLALELELPLVNEFAREYLSENINYSYDDLAKIAKGQLESEAEAFEQNSTIICDTDLITIAIWSLFKYKKCEQWILDACQPKLTDIYFLCGIDVPWEIDPLRENPSERLELYELHKNMLKKFGCNFFETTGTNADRLSFVRSLLA